MDHRLLGVHNAASLAQSASETRQFLVDNLIFDQSVNLVVGDSGLGKTALLVSLGVAVAAGLPWLGHRTSKGPVLMLDGESPAREFLDMVNSVSAHGGLAAPPDDFFVYSPNWDLRSDKLIDKPIIETLREHVKQLRPKLILIDPLRMFWPSAEGKQEDAVSMFKEQRRLSREFGTSWVLLHHRRKTSAMRETNLVADPHSWLEEAAGARALVNQSDTRLGIDKDATKAADIVVAGFARILGPIPAMRIVRDIDDNGEPRGYRALSGLDHLQNPRHRELFQSLPATFRYRDAYAALNSSGGSTSDFLNAITTLQLVRVHGEGRFRTFVKPEAAGELGGIAA